MGSLSGALVQCIHPSKKTGKEAIIYRQRGNMPVIIVVNYMLLSDIFSFEKPVLLRIAHFTAD